MWMILKTLFADGLDDQQRAVLWRLLLGVVVMVHLLMVYDAIPGLHSGFAKLSTVSEIKKSLQRVQENQLLEAIEKERRNVCLQLIAENGAAVSYAARRRSDLLRAYESLTGKRAEGVTCKELGIG